MSDKEKIKKEIERQIEEGKVKCQQSQENNDYESLVAWSEHVATCGKLLIFINSLPEESVVKGITWKDVNTLDTLINQVRHEFPNGISEKSFGLAVLEKFQDFYNDIEEPTSEDLEEAAKKFYTEIECYPPLLQQYSNHIEKAFKAGAKWQKQQMKETLQTEYEKGRFDMREVMMKDAVIARVNTYESVTNPYDNEISFITNLSPSKFKNKETVRIIIVKED